MPKPPRPDDEIERLEAVSHLALAGTPNEERFDKIVRLARAALRVPYAAVNIVERETLWAKSAEGGLPEPQTGRDLTYCGWAILDDEPTIIPDALTDERTSDNPHAAAFRFYAANPVRWSGKKVGAICIGGPEPRDLRHDEIALLGDLASMVESEFKTKHLGDEQRRLASELGEARRSAGIDSLTRVWSRAAILDLAQRELARGAVGFLMVDIDHFKNINDTYGHQHGDEVLRQIASRVRNSLRGDDAVGRYGGEEFLVVLPGCGQESLEVVAERIRVAVARTPVLLGDEGLHLTVSIGGAIGSAPEHFTDLILKGADEALYNAKAAGRNRVVTKKVTPSLYMRAIKLAPSSD